MDVPSDITISWQEVQMLLGERDVIIYQLQRDLQICRKNLAEMEKRHASDRLERTRSS